MCDVSNLRNTLFVPVNTGKLGVTKILAFPLFFFFQTSCQPLPFKPLKERAEEIGRRKDVGSDPYDPSSTYVNT